MNAQILALFNKQINLEFFSAYLYLKLSNYYAEENLNGFENWFHVQAQEELDHALLLSKYVHNNDERVLLEQIDKPDVNITSHIIPLELAYKHEKGVTAQIHSIYAVAYETKDFRSMQLLDWFIKEQGEEEKSASDLLAKMNLFGRDAKGLYLLNNELTERVYTAPSLVL